jgi:hypothetical protein
MIIGASCDIICLMALPYQERKEKKQIRRTLLKCKEKIKLGKKNTKPANNNSAKVGNSFQAIESKMDGDIDTQGPIRGEK